jgi:hypothetical protein
MRAFGRRGLFSRLVLGTLGAGLGCGGLGPEFGTLFEQGPFEVTFTVMHNVRRGTDAPWQRDYPYTEFQLLYGGQPASTKSYRLAFSLTAAPYPTVLVAADTFELVSDRNGRPEFVPIDPAPNEYTSWQVLDAAAGQPGAFHHFSRRLDTSPEDHVVDGALLFLDTRGVLDVRTLTWYPFDVSAPTSDGFRVQAAPMDHDGAVALSPDKRHVAFVGYRGTERALVVVDYVDNRRHAVPTGGSSDSVTPDWVLKRFSWDASGTLVPRTAAARIDMAVTVVNPTAYAVTVALASTVPGKPDESASIGLIPPGGRGSGTIGVWTNGSFTVDASWQRGEGTHNTGRWMAGLDPERVDQPSACTMTLDLYSEDKMGNFSPDCGTPGYPRWRQ